MNHRISARAAITAVAIAVTLAVSAPAAGASASNGVEPFQTAVFAGGCFWGVDAVFRHVKGVSGVESGYAGGSADTATYDRVSGGNTGHAEAVRVRFDPAQVTYGQLLGVFFNVAHDPTQLNRQGPDYGSQYRSAVFYTGPEQRQLTEDYVRDLAGAKTFKSRIVTEITPLKEFFPAEAYHQDYLAQHPNQPYIVINDLPKLDLLRRRFPDLYRPTSAP